MVMPSEKKSNAPGNHEFMDIITFVILRGKMDSCFDGI